MVFFLPSLFHLSTLIWWAESSPVMFGPFKVEETCWSSLATQSPLTCGKALCRKDKAKTTPGSVLTIREDGQLHASSDPCLGFVLCASINMTSRLLLLRQCLSYQSY